MSFLASVFFSVHSVHACALYNLPPQCPHDPCTRHETYGPIHDLLGTTATRYDIIEMNGR